ncbi:MAG: RiPP maturation radical SAM protein 1 [Gammaproteobacteria bacterium]|nr:RiPP maturation radical SAM protein 1 [Gammaproteobacteria bacterium]
MSRDQSGAIPLVLVVPPVLHPVMPPLGANLLAPTCIAAGIPTRVVEANVGYAARVGFAIAGRIAASPPYRLLGEALFLAAALPERAADHAGVLERLRVAQGPGTVAIRWQAAPLEDEVIARCLEAIPEFVATTAREIVELGARIVGFSSMGQQTLASIALAREIKRLDPSIVTVIGGSNATAPMGAGILAVSPALDYAFSGEADLEFPKFCRAYLEHGELPATKVVECLPVQDMDALPEPDYGAYFAALAPLRASDPIAAQAPNSLMFESSRGCWWGDKHLCKFCGYVPPAVGRYRMRSPGRIVEAIAALVERYGITHIRASDTIMPAQFPKTVLPGLVERGIECTLAYEIKSNHREDDLDLCVSAGISELQPGIETLASNILTQMDKGVSALENVRLLRNARSRQISLIWNFLSAIPGERSADYAAMAALIPLIEHLQAPVRWGPIHVSRYSPYQQDPAQYGISRLEPMLPYVECFGPLADQLCSNYEADYTTEALDDRSTMAHFEQAMEHWTELWQHGETPPVLERYPLDGGWAIVKDTRAAARQPWHLLSVAGCAALDAVRDPVREDQVPAELRAELAALVGAGLVAAYEGRHLALTVEPEIGAALVERRERHRRKIRAGEPARAAAATA